MKDYWKLYSTLVSIHWKNNKAVEVDVGGKIFKATKKKIKKSKS